MSSRCIVNLSAFACENHKGAKLIHMRLTPFDQPLDGLSPKKSSKLKAMDCFDEEYTRFSFSIFIF